MPIPEHLVPFLIRLRQATAANRVAWEEGASESEFLLSLSDSSVRLLCSYDSRADISRISLLILDSEGKLVDRITVCEGEKAYEEMEQLYEAARRKARRADEIMRGLMDQLDGEEIP